MNIINFPLKKGQYLSEETEKRQLVLHNTASSYSVMNVRAGWERDTQRVGTSYIVGGNPIKPPAWDITKDGLIAKCFDDTLWAWHIGAVKGANSTVLNSQSIGIEVCNWDYLNINSRGIISSYTGQPVPLAEVVEIAPFKGKNLFELYTDAQIESIRLLIDDICKRHKIPKIFNGKKSGITAKDFELSLIALKREKGIFAHSNYRTDKWDINPQPKMLYLLNNL